MTTGESIPDHYATLNIPVNADNKTIREAYKRAAFENHPDRAVNDSDRAARTVRFQRINEANYILSNPRRRQRYDESRHNSTPPPQSGYSPSDADAQFSDIFEEELRNDSDAFEDFLREEDGVPGHPGRPGYFYKIAGGFAGAILGFIIANVPGAVGGAVAGNRLGAIRDNKGKSVYEAFQELDPDARRSILARLAQSIFTQTMGL